MRNLTPALLEHLAGPEVTLATCLDITCSNGLLLQLTDHTEPIGPYQPGLMFRPMLMESHANASVDNTECDCLTNEVLNRQDIEAGLLTNARVSAKLVNYNNLEQGALASRKGFVGEVRTNISGLNFVMEIVGFADKLSATITEQCTPTCRASLGDARCQVDVAAMSVEGVVEVISTDGLTIEDSRRTEEAGWFALGKVKFTSGAAAGYVREVWTSNTGNFTLIQQMPKRVAVGDTYTLEPGCNRRRAVCRSKFNNVVNFRGEPFVPDPEKTFRPIS